MSMFVASWWILWLVAALFAAFAVGFQLKNIKNMSNMFIEGEFTKMGPVFLFSILSSLTGLMAIVSTVLMCIDYSKH